MDGDVFDEEIGEEIFGHRNRHQRDEIDQTVEDAALSDRRQESETDGQRHGDDRRIGGEEHRVGEARRNFGQHVAAIGERNAEIAAQRVEQPVEESHDRGPIESEVETQLGDALRRRGVLQDGRCEIARQKLRADEDEH